MLIKLGTIVVASLFLASSAFAQQQPQPRSPFEGLFPPVTTATAKARPKARRARCVHESDCRLCCVDNFGQWKCTFDVFTCGK